MPSLSFKSQFAGLVQTGKKTQSIRAPRKRPFKVGDTLYLFTAMRTKQCRQIGEGEVTEIKQVRIKGGFIWVDERGLTFAEATAFAIADGFPGVSSLIHWFREQHGLPFTGALIRWRLRTAP